MCTAGPNNNLWSTEATGIDINGCYMLCDSTVALFLGNGGCCGSTYDKMKNWIFCGYGNFGDKNHRFYLPAEQ